MEIPYHFQYPITPEIKAAVLDVLERRIHHFGPYCRSFETKLAAVCGVPHAVAAVGEGGCVGCRWTASGCAQRPRASGWR